MTWLKVLDEVFIDRMHAWAVPILRVCLGIVFLWFGLLKVFGVSPVVGLIQETYYFFPTKEFILILGIWEAAVGLGLIFNIALRATLALLWLQMAGTLFTFILKPAMFFSGYNPLLLTVEGEFVIKNLVLISAGLVIGGYGVKKLK
ncbi:MAG: hypothetical protein G01um10143_667 [Parcubacteria group bacterium Gr01-1014_3]|nr:MAG: hypothetical protein G01um10143_667 [Parcubacteria group bacterium Gr01-1014_3]